MLTPYRRITAIAIIAIILDSASGSVYHCPIVDSVVVIEFLLRPRVLQKPNGGLHVERGSATGVASRPVNSVSRRRVLVPASHSIRGGSPRQDDGRGRRRPTYCAVLPWKG